MNKEDMLFEPKPCSQCKHSCVEGQPGVKCPFDLMVEDILKKSLENYENTIENKLKL